jgi:hypothetical protein
LIIPLNKFERKGKGTGVAVKCKANIFFLMQDLKKKLLVAGRTTKGMNNFCFSYIDSEVIIDP